ncbi:hypothetical protein OK074_2098 [Actinobacteria bacterium OK074]|nr:hypothetical protein OK074_2098 [Actinobacteria bacterium OK074]
MADDLAKLAARIAAVERRLTQQIRASRLAYSSIEDGAMKVYDRDGTLRGSLGLQDDGSVAFVTHNGPPPPTPAPATVEAALSGLTVTWPGTWADAQSAPLDLAEVQIHITASADAAPDTTHPVATFPTAAGGSVTIATGTYDAVWVRLIAVNTSGTAGTPSTAVQGQARKAVPDDLVDAIIDETKLARAAVTDAALALGAVGSTALADDAVSTPKLLAGAVTAGKIAALAVTAEKIAALAITTEKLNALAVTTDKIAANAVTATQIAAGSIEATHIKAGAITADKLDADAVNGKRITGAVITGSVLQTAASGQRVVITPGSNPETGSIEFYSGSANESAPAELNTAIANASQGGVDYEIPSVSLSAPRTGDTDQETGLFLQGHVPDYSGAVFNLYANDVSGNGVAYVNGYGADTSAAGSSVDLFVRDAPSAGSASATARLTSTGLAVDRDLSVYGRAQGRGFVAQQSLTANVTFSSTETAIITTGSITFKTGRAYRISIWALHNAANESYALYRIRKGTVTGTVYKDQIRINNLQGSAANTPVSFQTIFTNTTGSDIATALCWTGIQGGVAQTWAVVASTANVAYLLVEDCGSADDYSGQAIV